MQVHRQRMQRWERGGMCRLLVGSDDPRSNPRLIRRQTRLKIHQIRVRWLVRRIVDDASWGWILKNFQTQSLRVMGVDRDMKRGIERLWQSMLCILETLGGIYCCILA